MAKFEKGNSGNPHGRPKGALSKHSQFRKLLEPHAEALIGKLIQLAKEGDIAAIKLCIERLIPKPKEEPIQFNLPEGDLHASRTLLNIGAYMLKAVSKGELTLEQAQQINKLVAAQCKNREQLIIEERIAEIERTLGIRKPPL